MFIGAHIKKESGTLLHTIRKIEANNGNALQLFVSNPMSAIGPNFKTYHDMSADIQEYCKQNNFKLVIHASYTINLAKEPKTGKRVLDMKDCYWIQLLISQLQVSDILNAAGVVVHVGKYTNLTVEQGIHNQFKAIQYIISQLKLQNIKSKLIIETPAGAGTELLCTIEDFLKFYNQFNADEKKHLGICIDTAHIWAAGYDITQYYNMLAKQNAKDVVVIHLNNSKKEQGSCVDAHKSLFDMAGTIPVDDIKKFLQHLKYQPIIILETPSDDLQKEIEWVANT